MHACTLFHRYIKIVLILLLKTLTYGQIYRICRFFKTNPFHVMKMLTCVDIELCQICFVFTMKLDSFSCATKITKIFIADKLFFSFQFTFAGHINFQITKKHLFHAIRSSMYQLAALHYMRKVGNQLIKIMGLVCTGLLL